MRQKMKRFGKPLTLLALTLAALYAIVSVTAHAITAPKKTGGDTAHKEASSVEATAAIKEDANEAASYNENAAGFEYEEKWLLAKEKVNHELAREKNRYVLYINDKKITKRGWHEVSGAKYRVNKNGRVTAKMQSANDRWKLYEFNPENAKWVRQKDLWKTILEKKYYFNASGICTKIYDKKDKTLYVSHDGKMVLAAGQAYALNDGKMYYFNQQGTRKSAPGWKKASSDKYYKVGGKGYVTAKMVKPSNVWKYYTYDYSAGKWAIQKQTWKTLGDKKYYFNEDGKCLRIYNTKLKKCYEYKNGKMTMLRSAKREVDGRKYYFGSNGVKVSSAGLYLSGAKKLTYVNAEGEAAKEISGKILESSKSGEKIKSCRVKDSHYMCYYNSKGTLTRKIDLNQKMVALTYDDGPSAHTQTILDVLKQYNSVATFFVVGECVPRYPDAVKRAYEIGCEIGNHTYNHKILTKIDAASMKSQVSKTNEAVKKITGVSPVVMRPPGGGCSDTVKKTVAMPLILWSIDTLDWKTRNSAATQAAVLNNVRDGDIVLMHDLHGPTAEASKVIIPELVKRGYQLVTVSELADCRGGMSKGTVYGSFRAGR